MMFAYAFLVLAAVVLTAGLLARKRVRDAVRPGEITLDDEAVRRIVEEGELEAEEDEPLDLEEIAREEERFWEESWDEPEGPFHP